MSNYATVEKGNPKVAPALTPEKIMPEILHRWERVCKEYFRVEGVTEKKKVKSILPQLEDLRIANWA
jgi:hypothetical protein